MKIFNLLFPTLPALLFAGGAITNNRYNSSLMTQTQSSNSFLASYGQLYCTDPQYIHLDSADTWQPIPFDAFGPSYNITGSTLSPATMTVQTSGVYQISLNIYFSSEESMEGTFTQTTYTVGTSINGSPTIEPYAATYCQQPGYFSLNYTTLQELSENDFVEFYIKSSATGGDPIFDNVVRLEKGTAYLVQIAQ